MRLVAQVAFGLLLAACGGSSEITDTVIVAGAQVREVTQSVVVIGTTEYAHPVDVSTEVPGRIVRTFVRAGDVVSVGQQLAQIDTEPLANAALAMRVERDRAALAVERLVIDSANGR